jgi:hypothetical protein
MFLVTRLWGMVQFSATNLKYEAQLGIAVFWTLSNFWYSKEYNVSEPASVSVFRGKGWGQLVVILMRKKNAHRILVGRPEAKRPLAKPRRRCRNL